jgi:hypothetical protein
MNSPPRSPRICVTATSGPADRGLGFYPMASAGIPRRSRAVGAAGGRVLQHCRRREANHSLVCAAPRAPLFLFVLNRHVERLFDSSGRRSFGSNSGLDARNRNVCFAPAERTSLTTDATSEKCQQETHPPQQDYSITSSARASSVAGISMPSIFAVLRLMTVSNFTDCTTGRSVGLAPLRICPA